tara:strand:+ start:1591 stop:2388 length:798 start_codon:yes stop_codon:yes gene_type:complete
MNFIEKINLDFNRLDFIEKVIATNIIVFISSIFLYLFDFHKYFIELFSLDNNFLSKPWSIFTYSFIHGFKENQLGEPIMQGISSLFELLIMIALLNYTSKSIKNLLGEKIIIQLFICGVIFGGIIFLFLNPINGGLIMGASAGISALLMFLFFLSPNMGLRIFSFTIEFKYIMSFILFVDFFRLIDPNDFGVYAHIGGYLVGLFFYFSIYGFPKINNKTRIRKKPKKYTNKQRRIDKILDKISKSGYDSLDEEEKEFLFRQGHNK